ncbi:MAG: exopolyphosphatase [Acidobacteriota bacterium]
MRLVTRPDLDGLACALMLTESERFDEVVLVHPQEITDKTVEILPEDTLANVPYHPSCGRWFDHHLITASNETPPANFNGLHRVAPSAAQLVWEFVGEPERWRSMVEETNRFDSAQLSENDILKPTGWILLGFTVDPRSGLHDRHGYFGWLLEQLAEASLEEILLQPEVQGRITTMFEHNENFAWELMQRSRLLDNVVFTDFRGAEAPPVGNRFLIYTLFPEANVSVRAQFDKGKENVWVTAGHSIFDRSCNVSIGELMSDFGGGGHRGAGSTRFPVLDAELSILEILERLRQPVEAGAAGAS